MTKKTYSVSSWGSEMAPGRPSLLVICCAIGDFFVVFLWPDCFPFFFPLCFISFSFSLFLFFAGQIYVSGQPKQYTTQRGTAGGRSGYGSCDLSAGLLPSRLHGRTTRPSLMLSRGRHLINFHTTLKKFPIDGPRDLRDDPSGSAIILFHLAVSLFSSR